MKYPVEGKNDLGTVRPDLVHNLVGGLAEAKKLLPRSNKKVDWVCDLGHTWSASVDKVSSLGRWCPYCAGKKVLAGFNDLATKNPALALTMVDSKITAHQVSEWSHIDALWICEDCNHIWRCRVANRSLGRGCPRCANSNSSKPEKLTRDFLHSHGYNVNKDHLARVNINWRTKSSIQVDSVFTVRDKHFIVEYDGSFYHKDEDVLTKDREKTSLFLRNEFLVVRIREQSYRYKLPFIDINDENLLQLNYYYTDSTYSKLYNKLQEVDEWIRMKVE